MNAHTECDTNRPALLGRNWMETVTLDWSSIRAVTLDTGIASVDEIVKRHLPIFKEGYGGIKDFKAKIYLRLETTPVFGKARPVKFARYDNWTRHITCRRRAETSRVDGVRRRHVETSHGDIVCRRHVETSPGDVTYRRRVETSRLDVVRIRHV